MKEIQHSCCFFGHRDAPKKTATQLEDIIEYLITIHDVTNFYVGNNGNFDAVVLSVLKEIANKYPKVSFDVVLAYLPSKVNWEQEEHTLYPFGIECVPKRFCISWRNKWLIDHSQFVVCYVTHITGGAAKFREMAIKKGKTVLDIL